MTSQERSMLYYFLDSIFGCPADLDTLSKMIQKTAQERKLSDDFVRRH